MDRQRIAHQPTLEASMSPMIALTIRHPMVLAWLMALALALLQIGTADAAFDHQYKAFGSVLDAAVSHGKVDYNAVKQHQPELDAHLNTVANLSAGEFETFSRAQQLAFYINAYNGRILHEVASHYPIKSVMDIQGVFKKNTFTVAGRLLTLDRLENEVLRPTFHEPRIHFAINCAARSCPPLQGKPFTANQLDQQLEQAARGFMTDPKQNRYDPTSNTVQISKLLEWFGGDFLSKYPDASPRKGLTPEQAAVLTFAAQFVGQGPMKTFLRSGTPRVVFMEYDWRLNSV